MEDAVKVKERAMAGLLLHPNECTTLRRLNATVGGTTGRHTGMG